MWNFIKGVKPPPAKKSKQADDEKREKARTYEKDKRKRQWNPKWAVDEAGKKREWLKYEQSTDEMFCTSCREYCSKEALRKGPFVVGTSHFKLESIKDHEDSQGHKLCQNIVEAKNAPLNTTAAEKALTSQFSRGLKAEPPVQNCSCHCKEGKTIHRLCMDM